MSIVFYKQMNRPKCIYSVFIKLPFRFTDLVKRRYLMFNIMPIKKSIYTCISYHTLGWLIMVGTARLFFPGNYIYFNLLIIIFIRLHLKFIFDLHFIFIVVLYYWIFLLYLQHSLIYQQILYLNLILFRLLSLYGSISRHHF